MPTPSAQLLSRTEYLADGVTTSWDFSFSGGYISRDHVKAYSETSTGIRTNLTIMPGDFVGDYTLTISPAIASGDTLVIYRDTPKDIPLVNYTDGGRVTEASLDLNAEQAVFIAAETTDIVNTSDAIAAGAAAASAAASAAAALAATAPVPAAVAAAVAASEAAVAAAAAITLPIPLISGGTGASYADLPALRTGIDVPSRSGVGASGSWGINVTGNAATATIAANNVLRAGDTMTGNLVVNTKIGVGTSAPFNLVHIQGAAATTGATQLTLEGYYSGYGAGVSFQSRTSAGGTQVEMAKITADGEDTWNTTTSTQDAGLSFYTSLNGTVNKRLKLTSVGDLLLGTSSSGALGMSLVPGIGINWAEGSNSSLANLFRQNITGALILGSGVKYSSTSGAFASSYAGSWSRSAVAVAAGGVEIYTAPAAVVSVGTDTTMIKRMSVDGDGRIYTGLGTSSPYNYVTAAAANMVVDSAGMLGRSTSSLRYKTDVRDYADGLSKLMQLRPVLYKGTGKQETSPAYNRKAGVVAVSRRDQLGKTITVSPDFAGFIAEEVDAAGLTEFVAYDTDGNPDALYYANMTALLVKAVQEQQEQIAELTAKLAKVTG